MKSIFNAIVRGQGDQAGLGVSRLSGGWTRREFLRSTVRTVAASSLALLDASRFAHSAGSGAIRLGLVGCGGRGSGAARNALATGKDVKLVSMADIFEDRIASCLEALRRNVPGDQLQVNGERRFAGFDGFEKLLAAGVDAVILATPPGFHPNHFEAAVRAGAHCFLEKPVAVDAPGVRQVRAATQVARQKKLSVIVGLQDRFDKSCEALMAEIFKGAIGRITRQQAIIHSKPVRDFKRSAVEAQLGRRLTEMEFQIRNWFSFTWLSGDLLVEWLVHGIDNCLWAAGNHPHSARGSAERREHTRSDSGDRSDFLSVQFGYAGGSEMLAEICSLAAATSRQETTIEGERGTAKPPGTIVDQQGKVIWKYSGPRPDRYQEEMDRWCASIRQGTGLNTVESAADSTLAAIMGRTAAYTGREITWDEIAASTETFFTRNPGSFQDDPPVLPDKFGDYITPPRGRTS